MNKRRVEFGICIVDTRVVRLQRTGDRKLPQKKIFTAKCAKQTQRAQSTNPYEFNTSCSFARTFVFLCGEFSDLLGQLFLIGILVTSSNLPNAVVNLNERTRTIKSAINIVARRVIRLPRCGDKKRELWMICEDTNHGDSIT